MSFLGKLGKGLVKVGKIAAPIALTATGVGAPFAAMAAGGLSALDTKLSGGSWKNALASGAIGAGTSLIPGGTATGKGLSPGKGVLGMIGAGAKKASTSMLGDSILNATLNKPTAPKGIGPSSKEDFGQQQPQYMPSAPMQGNPFAPANMADMLYAGMQESRFNQPFRSDPNRPVYSTVGYGGAQNPFIGGFGIGPSRTDFGQPMYMGGRY